MRKLILTFFIVFLSFSIAPMANAISTKYTNQDVTAYVASSGSRTYHGTIPSAFTTVAVHPLKKGIASSGTLFPFGAIIKTDSPLQLTSNVQKTYFIVEDMGDVNYDRNLSSYWFDIYYGLSSNSLSLQAAINFGKQKVNYEVSY